MNQFLFSLLLSMDVNEKLKTKTMKGNQSEQNKQVLRLESFADLQGRRGRESKSNTKDSENTTKG